MTHETCPIGIAGHRWILRIRDNEPDLILAEGEVCVPRYPWPSACQEDVNGFEMQTEVFLDDFPVRLVVREHSRWGTRRLLEIQPAVTTALTVSEIVEEQLRPVREAFEERRRAWQPAIEQVLALWADSGPYLPPEHQADLTDQLLDALDAKGTEPRKWTHESGKGRVDIHGVEWFACDPYPTWYRVEDGEVIVPDEELNWLPEENEQTPECSRCGALLNDGACGCSEPDLP